MLIIGIDPGIKGAICILKDGKILDVFDMPIMPVGKKNKSQVNGSQIYNEIQKVIINEESYTSTASFLWMIYQFIKKLSNIDLVVNE